MVTTTSPEASLAGLVSECDIIIYFCWRLLRLRFCGGKKLMTTAHTHSYDADMGSTLNGTCS